jgi:hypothetical protein
MKFQTREDTMKTDHQLTLPLVRALDQAGFRAANITPAGEATYITVDVEGRTLTLTVTENVATPDRRSEFTKIRDAAIEAARERGEYEAGDENLLALEATCFMNMTADAGRPSDAMRSTTRADLSDPTK